MQYYRRKSGVLGHLRYDGLIKESRIARIPYILCENAGLVPYKQWHVNNGTKIILLDKDGTITPVNEPEFDPDVIAELKRRNLSSFLTGLAIISNNPSAADVELSADLLAAELDIEVLPLSVGHGYRRKSDPEMGQVATSYFKVASNEAAVVGDRLWVDVAFAQNMGAGAVALCRKVGKGDARGVPPVRYLENRVVAWEQDRRRVRAQIQRRRAA